MRSRNQLEHPNMGQRCHTKEDWTASRDALFVSAQQAELRLIFHLGRQEVEFPAIACRKSGSLPNSCYGSRPCYHEPIHARYLLHDPISVKGLTVGTHSTNAMGQMDGETLQNLAQIYCADSARKAEAEFGGPPSAYEIRYGKGHNLQRSGTK